MTKNVFILISFFIFNATFGQVSESKLLDTYYQSKNEFIYWYGYSPTAYHIGHRIKTADSVTVRLFNYPKQNIQFFLDSISQKGYIKIKPKTIKKNVNCKLNILTYNFYSMDTIQSGTIDSCFVVSVVIEFSLNGSQNRQWKYETLYTHAALKKLKKFYSNNKWFTLKYFTTSNIYQIGFRLNHFDPYFVPNSPSMHIYSFYEQTYF